MYPISEDSIFFAEFLENYISKLNNKENLKYLDMGTGSGILSVTALKAGLKKENIFAADIDSEAVKFAKNKGLNAIKSNLFSKFKKGRLNVKGNLVPLRFDIITWNSPYLPDNEHDKQKDTSGGKKGDEASLKFLKQAKAHLKDKGKILLLISSITPQNKIKKFKPKILAKKHIFFEDLLILEIT